MTEEEFYAQHPDYWERGIHNLSTLAERCG